MVACSNAAFILAFSLKLTHQPSTILQEQIIFDMIINKWHMHCAVLMHGCVLDELLAYAVHASLLQVAMAIIVCTRINCCYVGWFDFLHICREKWQFDI